MAAHRDSYARSTLRSSGSRASGRSCRQLIGMRYRIGQPHGCQRHHASEEIMTSGGQLRGLRRGFAGEKTRAGNRRRRRRGHRQVTGGRETSIAGSQCLHVGELLTEARFCARVHARLAADCRFELETSMKLYAIDPSELTDSDDTSF